MHPIERPVLPLQTNAKANGCGQTMEGAMPEYLDDRTLSRLTVGELQFLLQTLQREIAALPEGSKSRAIAWTNAKRVRSALLKKSAPNLRI